MSRGSMVIGCQIFLFTGRQVAKKARCHPDLSEIGDLTAALGATTVAMLVQKALLSFKREDEAQKIKGIWLAWKSGLRAQHRWQGISPGDVGGKARSQCQEVNEALRESIEQHISVHADVFAGTIVYRGTTSALGSNDMCSIR